MLLQILFSILFSFLFLQKSEARAVWSDEAFHRLYLNGEFLNPSPCYRCLGRSNELIYEIYKMKNGSGIKQEIDEKQFYYEVKDSQWIILAFESPYNFTYALNDSEAHAKWNSDCQGREKFLLLRLNGDIPEAVPWMICQAENAQSYYLVN